MFEGFYALAATIVIISITGVMSPGPLLAANISHGIRGGMKSGLKMAVGHTIVEAPIIMILALGITSFSDNMLFVASISIIGALGLFFIAIIQIKSTIRKTKSNYVLRSPVITGIMLTGLNPVFILWWATIGLKLITDATHQWGMIGIPLMFALHIWMDYVWMMFVGKTSNKISKFISNKIYRIIMLGMSAILIYFGIKFSLDFIMYFK